MSTESDATAPTSATIEPVGTTATSDSTSSLSTVAVTSTTATATDTTTAVTSSSTTSTSTTASTSTSSSSAYVPGTTHGFLIFDNLFVVDSRYLPVKPIGRGAYGIVCAAMDRSIKDNKKVAIKKISNAFHDLVDGKRDLREIKLLRHFKHDNIVKLMDVMGPTEDAPFQDVYMVLEFMETDLHKIIHSKQELSDAHIQYFLYQLLCGLKYIHSAGVIHRDIKPSNLLVNSDCQLRICDFGLARSIDDDTANVDAGPGGAGASPLTEYVVTRWYRAPEVILGCPYDYKIDVWSVGCILAEFLLRQPLFPSRHSDFREQLDLIFELLGTPQSRQDVDFISHPAALEYVLTVPTKFSCQDWVKRFPSAAANPHAIDLLQHLLCFNPNYRYSVDDALAHPYFASRHHRSREPKCPFRFDFSFERLITNKDVLQDLMWTEILFFHPDLQTRGFRRAKNAPLVQPTEYHFATKSARPTDATTTTATATATATATTAVTTAASTTTTATTAATTATATATTATTTTSNAAAATAAAAAASATKATMQALLDRRFPVPTAATSPTSTTAASSTTTTSSDAAAP